jgi:hypothetical protein
MGLLAEPKLLYAIACDGCTEVYADPEYADSWFLTPDEVRKLALDSDWTHEGEGLEERWHCSNCPALALPASLVDPLVQGVFDLGTGTDDGH